MGGLDELSALLWSPTYGVVLVAALTAIGLFLRNFAPVSFSMIGLRNCIRGASLTILWVLVLSVIWNGFSVAMLLAFSVAAYFSLIGVMVFCIPLAMILARCGLYRMGWFVALGVLLSLGMILVVEIAIGPQISNGLARWRGSVVGILASCAPGLLAFAVGARLPMKSSATTS